MRVSLVSVIMASAAAALAGCGTFEVDDNMRKLELAEPRGSEFSRRLSEEYKELAAFEKNEMYDWTDANRFARKGLRAADGEPAQPEDLDDWSLPAEERSLLGAARQRLVQAIDDGAPAEAPARAAVAQASFDCWVEQQEENHQPAHIAACRDEFWAALGDVEETLRLAKAAPAGEARAPREIFFDFDKADLSLSARQVLDELAAQAAEKAPLRIVVEGHADRAGPSDYNMELSRRRADAVRHYLAGNGATDKLIVERAFGESRPAVETGDGVPAPGNRRAVIRLEE